MTITTVSASVQYAGNGTTTSFAFVFPITAAANLVVVLTDANGVDTTQTLTTDYTVTVASYPGSGSLTMVTPPASGETLTIRRILALTQSVDLQNQGAFFAETHEAAFDRYVMVDQQQQDALDRSLHFPVSEASGYNSVLPIEATRKGAVLAFNATTGDPEAVAVSGFGALPAPGTLAALDMIRVNAGKTAYEAQTQTQVAASLAPVFANGAISGNKIAGGTISAVTITALSSNNVDGRDLSVDGAKLDGIEANATADQSNAEIKTAYEANADTNEFSDAEQTKLAGIEAAADVTDAVNVAASLHASLASISGLTTQADRMIYATASNTYAVATLTAAARALLDDTGAAAMLTTLGVYGWEKIEALTASSSASLDFETGLTSTYDAFMLIVTNLLPASDNVDLWLRVKDTTYKSGAADYENNIVTQAAVAAGFVSLNNSTGVAQIPLTDNQGNVSGSEAVSGIIRFSAPSVATVHHFRGDLNGYEQGANARNWRSWGVYNGTSNAITGVRLIYASGNIASGTATLYGLRK